MRKTIVSAFRRIKRQHLQNNIQRHEKRLQIKDNTFLKYLFFHKQNNNSLIIVFSGMSEDKAKYNYTFTLSNIKADKLYILDDFGEDRLGCYYLCVNNDYYVESGVKKLIGDTIRKKNYKNIFFVGSSKGGWASLYYGLDYPKSNIIIGAPQYYLGDYLLIRKSRSLLYTIVGKEYTKNEIDYINCLISNKIKQKQDVFNGKIYIHYSDNEHTYSEHIKSLLEDLKLSHYNVEEDILRYNSHDNVALYYPDYLIQTIKRIIE